MVQKEGLAFYLIPDFERMKQIGIAKTITGAMNQAFFTLSLGIGAMAIFGKLWHSFRTEVFRISSTIKAGH